MSCWAVEDGEDWNTARRRKQKQQLNLRCDEALSENLQLSSSHHLGWISQEWDTSADSTVCCLCSLSDCSHLLFTHQDDCVVVWWCLVVCFWELPGSGWQITRQWAVISTVWMNSQCDQVKSWILCEEEIFQQQLKIQDRQQTLHELNKKQTCGRGKRREQNKESYYCQ